MAQKTRILVVDDEPAVVRFVRTGLNALGYDVTTASGGEEALGLVAKKKFDIMLLDVFMKPVSGLDVLERLGPDRKLPVIVFSAGSSVIERVMQAGADAFIAKPVRPDQLAQKIEEVLKRKKVAVN
jgi:two-component system KDP operon response regulator KdpE